MKPLRARPAKRLGRVSARAAGRTGERFYEVFLSLGARLSTARTPLEAVRAVYAAADQLWHWDAAALDLYSPEKNTVQSVLDCDVIGGRRREVAHRLPDRPASPRMLRIMHKGAELMLRQSKGLPAAEATGFGDLPRPTEAKMYVPIRREGQAIGVLSIQSYTPNAYSREDLRTLQILADYCAGALERIRTSEALQQREELNRTLKEAFLSLGARLSAARTPAIAARAIYASADLLWKWDCGVLDLQVPGTELVETALAYDIIDGQRREVTLSPPIGPPSRRLRRVLAHGAELLLRQPGEPPPDDSLPVGDASRTSVSLMTVPVRQEGRPVGILSVQSYQTNAFTREDLDMLQALADYCGGALERLASEAALRETEGRYRSLINNLTVGVYRTTPEPAGRVLEANPALARMYGYESLKDFQQTRVSEHYQNSGERQLLIQQVLERGMVVNAELQLQRKDGTPFWGSTSATAHYGADGQVDWIDGILEDITERKQAEVLLQVQRDLGVKLSMATTLEAAFDSLLDISLRIRGIDCGGVYLQDRSGDLHLVAHRGVSPGLVRSLAHVPAHDPRAQSIRRRRPLVDQGAPRKLRPDDPFRLEGMRASAFLPLSHEQELLGALVLGSHIHKQIPAQSRVVLEAVAAQAAGAIARIRAEGERYRLEHQILEISDREQARIGQDIHDGLCQQLVSLAFDANSLRTQLALNPGPETRLAQRIADLLDRAITESRQLSRGLFPIRLEQEGLVPALEELARTTRQRARVRCRFSNKSAVLVENSTVATHLYRIAQEAVNNAVKHSRASSIAIRLCARAGRLELNVEDNGGGLTSKASAQSKGMGLHIMNYRARTIGGTLGVVPRARGGTLVSCRVPVPSVP